MEVAKLAAKRSTALGWPQFPRPKPLPKSGSYDTLITGWGLNVYTRKVYRVWQSSVFTYFNADRKHGSRSTEPVYATEAEAWQALLHELAEQYAAILADVRENAFPDGPK